MKRLLPLLLAAVTACSNSGYADVTVPTQTQPTQPTQPAAVDVPAVGVDLVGVTLYQGVEISLFDASGDIPAIQAPMIVNRDALVRVFVQPDEAFVSRRIKVVLEVEDNQGIEVFEEKFKVEGRSYRGQMETTFNFEIPGDLLKKNTKFNVSLYEVPTSGPQEGTELNTTWKSGSMDWVRSDTLTIRVIPVRYNPAGGLLPDTSQSQIDSFYNMMKSMYPVEEIVIEVDNPIDWNQTISPWNVNGWSDLLYEIADRRNSASVDPNTYFYGLFVTTQSFSEFCAQGCILGLSNLAWNANDPWYRSSIGIGYGGFGQVAASTLVHEVGHAHGREHADCGGAQGIDRDYPYGPNAIIGSWGYDTRTGFLYDPNENHDMMAYCEPMWISDYQYYNLYLRIAAIGQVGRQARIPWQTFKIDDQGHARFDKIRELTPNVSGAPVEVELLDARGNVVEVADGRFSPLSHGYGGTVMTDLVTDPRVVDVRVPALELDR